MPMQVDDLSLEGFALHSILFEQLSEPRLELCFLGGGVAVILINLVEELFQSFF